MLAKSRRISRATEAASSIALLTRIPPGRSRPAARARPGIGQPIGLAEVSPIADEDVIEDDIEAPAGSLEVEPRVALYDFDAEPIEVEPAARRANDLRVDLDTRDPRLGRESPHDPRGAAAAQAQDQHPASPLLGEQQKRRRQRVPHRARDLLAGLIPGREGSVDPERTPLAAALDLDSIGLRLSGAGGHPVSLRQDVGDKEYRRPRFIAIAITGFRARAIDCLP